MPILQHFPKVGTPFVHSAKGKVRSGDEKRKKKKNRTKNNALKPIRSIRPHRFRVTFKSERIIRLCLLRSSLVLMVRWMPRSRHWILGYPTVHVVHRRTSARWWWGRHRVRTHIYARYSYRSQLIFRALRLHMAQRRFERRGGSHVGWDHTILALRH